MAVVEKVLIINFLDLPKEHQDAIQNFEAFGNDRILNYVSEMSPTEAGETWTSNLSHDTIESYWRGQCDDNHYEGTFQEFIDDYGLNFDVWLLSQNFDLNVSKILIEICW